MYRIIACLVIFAFVSGVQGQPSLKGEVGDFSNFSNEEIVNSIKLAENSLKYPYGIKSVKCSGEKECRKICFNSVRNGRARWELSDKKDDLITAIGKRYSPPKENPNWVRLVKYFLTKAREK